MTDQRPRRGLELPEVVVHDTAWEPSSVQVTLNVTLDACIVPSDTDNARVDVANLLVLDNFVDDATRQQLLDFVTRPGWDHTQGPPQGKWEKTTSDAAYLPRSWGLNDTALKELASANLPAKLEVQSRLAKLYPEFAICHMPSHLIQQSQQAAHGEDMANPELHPGPQPNVSQEPSCKRQRVIIAASLHVPHVAGQQSEPQKELLSNTLGEQRLDDQLQGHRTVPHIQADSQFPRHCTGQRLEDKQSESDEENAPNIDCNQFVANAAVHGDQFSWHVDADPWTLPHSAWTQNFGHYFNREPGKPLFVSLLLYLDDVWQRNWDAETLFLDTPTDTGIFIRPKAGRVVLMDQDILHRLSPPSRTAGRPRYSLVWKLVFLPRTPGQTMSLTRKEWGRPTAFGSAARLHAVIQAMRAEQNI